MKRKGFSLIEVIIALSLLSILVLAMIPILTSAAMQLKQLEELRLQNEFLQNLITCVKQEAPLEVEGRYLLPTEGVTEGGTHTLEYRGRRYHVSGEHSASGLFWFLIQKEGLDEPIRILRTD